MNSETTSVSRGTYLGVFLIALATLMYEILLTRIFSVTMWYHFAFMAISVAMFGMTFGALLVYLFPGFFRRELTGSHLVWSALLFGATIALTFPAHLSIPFVAHASLTGLFSLAFSFALVGVPFVFSGICICLALTRFPRKVSRVYAADLAGAATGCLLVVFVLEVTDGPTAVIVAALLGCLAATAFARDTSGARVRRLARLASLGLGAFALLNTLLVREQASLFPLLWVKGSQEGPALYQKWNAYSRVRIEGDPLMETEPIGWGLSNAWPRDQKVRQLGLTIDASAATVLTGFDGDLAKLEYLKYDITNLAHHLRPRARVLVVGSGGGRDVLSALVFEQESVLGVEINHDILKALGGPFREFTGHLDRHPRVRLVNDEARSYVARSEERFDILQVSLIDTWAATAAGAFVLSENSLYTTEAWVLFLSRLRPNGLLTFSRWYLPKQPAQTYRLVALARAALEASEVSVPAKHIALVRHEPRVPTPENPAGIATLLVNREPFTDESLDELEKFSEQMEFEILLSPRHSGEEFLAELVGGPSLRDVVSQYPANIAPPTDDSPFFFQTDRLTQALRVSYWTALSDHHGNAVFILGVLLLIVAVLTTLCLLAPLAAAEKGALQGGFPFTVFFSAIGFGFMLVEISQMQRLIVFLGHPTFALSVVLFALLLSSGLGSYATQRIRAGGQVKSSLAMLALLVGALTAFGLLTPHVTQQFGDATNPARIFVAVAVLVPIGLCMGMPFPLGMKLASQRAPRLTPWLWGINGATSVCASVVAVVIALSWGIAAAFWTGVACYAAAFVGFVWASHGGESPQVEFFEAVTARDRGRD